MSSSKKRTKPKLPKRLKAATRPFDPAEYLNDDEAMAEYMAAAVETADADFIADARKVIARAKARLRRND